MSILQTLIEYIIFDEANEYFTAYSLPLRLLDILDQTRSKFVSDYSASISSIGRSAYLQRGEVKYK